MIKKCMWKGKRVSCSAIFTMHPTDRGMCCTFNKERADKLFHESRFRNQMMKMNYQDKAHSHEKSSIPDWQVNDLITKIMLTLLMQQGSNFFQV